MADGEELPAPGARVCERGAEGWSAELGAEICARIAAGASLRAVCLAAGMPHRTSVRNWAHARLEFAAALAQAQDARRIRWRERDARKWAAWMARPKPPRGGRPSTYTAAMGRRICERLMNGESVLRMSQDADMPCAGTIYGWAHRHPAFRAMYEAARTIQADYLFDESREVALGATPKSVWADRLRFDAIRWQTARLSPRKYVERLQVATLLAQDAAAAGAAQADEAAGPLEILMTRFVVSPKDPSQVVAIPPRNTRDAAAYEAAFGKPYDGPGAATAAELAAGDKWASAGWDKTSRR